MNLPLPRILMTAATFCLAALAQAPAQITPGEGWPQMNRTLDIGNFWDTFTNRHYGGYGQAPRRAERCGLCLRTSIGHQRAWGKTAPTQCTEPVGRGRAW